MRRTRLRLAGLAALCLLFPSCMSKQPLGDFKQAVVDKHLLGTWVLVDDDKEVHYFHIGRPKANQAPKGFVQVLEARFRSDQALIETDAIGFSITVGDCRYLNLSLIVDKDRRFDPTTPAPLGWLFLKYQIDGDRVEVWAADPRFVKREIKAGKIAGPINWGGATLTDSSENLAKWVAANDAKIFVEKTILQRVVVKQQPAP